MDQRRPFLLVPVGALPNRLLHFVQLDKQVFAFLLHRVNQHLGFTHVLLVLLLQLLRGSTAVR